MCFNAVLEKAMGPIKKKWRQRSEYGKKETDLLCNLRLADDVIIMARSRHQLNHMLEDLAEATEAIGIKLHTGKARIMSTGRSGDTPPSNLQEGGHTVKVFRKDGATMYLRLLSL